MTVVLADRSVTVEVDYFFGDKPYLGGYRHRKTKREYHNAATQTENKSKSSKREKEMKCMQVQTRPEIDVELQTTQEKATQMPRLGLYVLKQDDKEMVYSGKYVTAEELIIIIVQINIL